MHISFFPFLTYKQKTRGSRKIEKRGDTGEGRGNKGEEREDRAEGTGEWGIVRGER